MKILEHYICGKNGKNDICEDALILSNHIIAVIDGVTSKGTHLWKGSTSGYYAKLILSEYLRKNIEKQNATELLENLNSVLYKAIQNENECLSFEEFPRASIIIYNDLYKEIWSYGDCSCIINNNVYIHRKNIDQLNAELRAFYLEYLLSQGMNIGELLENDLGRKKIYPNLIMQFAFENKTGYFGYPVINGTKIEKAMIKRYSVTEGDTVILASDGYPVLKPSLSQSEKALNHIIKNDPLCFRLYRSTKGILPGNLSFDDRTFCKFIV